MAAGFKGTRVDVDWLEVKDTPGGVVVEYRTLFRDGDGVVHGTMKHTIQSGASPGIETAVRALVKALANHATNAHFDQGETDDSIRGKGGGYGIAEAIRASAPGEGLENSDLFRQDG